jgi:ABC-type multidrug transport system fused ATPase/permease subunit
MQERLASLTSVLSETLGNIRVVKAFGAEDFEQRRFDGEPRILPRLRAGASPGRLAGPWPSWR